MTDNSLYVSRSSKLDKIRRQVNDANTKGRVHRLPCTLTIEQWLSCLNYWQWLCAACGTDRRALSLDHYISVNVPDSPGTVMWNVIPLCVDCNRRKQDDSFDKLVRRLVAVYICDDLLAIEKARQYIDLAFHGQVALDTTVPDKPMIKAHSRNRPEKEARWSVRFELAPENPDHVLLHEHLFKLAETGEAAQWMRSTLINSITAIDNASVSTVVQSADPEVVEVEHPTDFKSMNDDFLRKSSGVPLARPAPKPVVRSFDPDKDVP